jgi:RND family efflux transporter MFP subunit
MKRFCGSGLTAIVILAILASPVFAAPQNNVSAQKTVTASAVVVPAQVSKLGFLISGVAREIPVKEGDLVQAGQTLMALDTPELQFAVTEAEAGLRAAQAEAEIRQKENIRKFKIDYTTFSVEKFWVSAPREVIEIANANVQRAQASLEFAQASEAQGTLLAPHAGTIASLKVIPGEFVPSDEAVVTLATLDNLQIETTDLRERDIPNVHLGDPVDIFIEALNKNITGKVIGLSPIASTVGGDVVFKVTIAPDNQPAGLLWGMTAEVEIRGK